MGNTMANDDKLILLNQEQKTPFFTLPESYGLAEKPKGILNFETVATGLAFGAAAFFLAPATLSAGAVAGLMAASAVAGGLIMGVIGEKGRSKAYDIALQQQTERLENAKAKGLSPSEALEAEMNWQKEGKRFLEAEIIRRSQQAAANSMIIQ